MKQTAIFRKIMDSRVIFYVAGALFLILFGAYSLLVKKRFLVNLDFDTTVRIQDKVPVHLDPLLSLFSLFGSFEVTLTVLIIILLVRRKIGGVLIFMYFGIAHIVEIIGKSFLSHPGPPFMFFRYDLHFFFPSTYVQTGSSYPSGHSMRTVFLGILFLYLIVMSPRLHLLIKIAACAGIICFMGIMLISRVSLGEHWSTDVLGGSLLGVAFGFFSVPLLNTDYKGSHRGRRMASVLLQTVKGSKKA